MYPFLAVLIGGAVVAMGRVHRGWGYAAVTLVGWHGVSTLHAAPNYLAYSNEFWGGPSATHRYLTDSNVDWGQQLVSGEGLSRPERDYGLLVWVFCSAIDRLQGLRDSM